MRSAQAQVRFILILGLDRLPLRRRRSHQFDHPARQLTFFPFPAASAYAMAEASWRNVSPLLITAHAILAILLATANDHARRSPLKECVDGCELALVAAITDHGGGAEHESLHKYASPFFEIFPIWTLPPDPDCSGTKPYRPPNALAAVVQEAYLQGVSVRKLGTR